MATLCKNCSHALVFTGRKELTRSVNYNRLLRSDRMRKSRSFLIFSNGHKEVTRMEYLNTINK